MKPYSAILFLALAVALYGDQIPTVTIGDRAFAFAFDDASLTDSVKLIIAADVSRLWGEQPGSVVQRGANGAERLFNDSMWASPYQNGLELPDQIVGVGAEKSVRITRKVSAAYQSAITFAFAHSNEVSAIESFIAALAPAAISNSTPEALSSLLFGQGAITADDKPQIISDITKTHFDHPSLLGFSEMPAARNGIPQGSLLVAIPCHDCSSGKWNLWAAVWLDDRWQLLPPE